MYCLHDAGQLYHLKLLWIAVSIVSIDVVVPVPVRWIRVLPELHPLVCVHLQCNAVLRQDIVLVHIQNTFNFFCTFSLTMVYPITRTRTRIIII